MVKHVKDNAKWKLDDRSARPVFRIHSEYSRQVLMSLAPGVKIFSFPQAQPVQIIKHYNCSQ
jgi:hypothetical protein